MKNNVLNTLIIAFILIAGWTLFTVWQDLSNTNGVGGTNTFLSHGRNYLPVIPNAGSENRNLPVYKGPGASVSVGRTHQSGSTYSGGKNLFSSSAFDISQPSAIMNSGVIESGNAYGTVSRRSAQSGSQNIPSFSLPSPRGLFSRNNNSGLIAKDETEKSSSSQTSISGSSLAGGGPMKVFGEGEGDPLEGGGGNENLNEYNDNPEVPVGGGLFVLMAFAGMYILFRKRRIL